MLADPRGCANEKLNAVTETDKSRQSIILFIIQVEKLLN
jgi:hypothetical protein